jgi:hypothetical protein
MPAQLLSAAAPFKIHLRRWRSQDSEAIDRREPPLHADPGIVAPPDSASEPHLRAARARKSLASRSWRRSSTRRNTSPSSCPNRSNAGPFRRIPRASAQILHRGLVLNETPCGAAAARCAGYCAVIAAALAASFQRRSSCAMKVANAVGVPPSGVRSSSSNLAAIAGV